MPTSNIAMPISSLLLNRKQEADALIRRYTMYSAGAGLLPIPFTDALTMTGIQVTMIRRLATIYEIDFQNQWGKTLSAAFLGSIGSVTGLKFIPGIGTILGAASSSTIGAASTYAMGQIFAQHFDQGGTLLDFDPVASRKYFKQELEKGKQFIIEMKNSNGVYTMEKPTHAILQQLVADSHQHIGAIKALQEEIEKLKAQRTQKVPSNPNDLKIIEGIGPKTEAALKAAGLKKWRQVANTEAYVIKELLDKAEGNFKLADPKSWPEQARLAMEGKFEALKELQDILIGGKYPDDLKS